MRFVLIGLDIDRLFLDCNTLEVYRIPVGINSAS